MFDFLVALSDILWYNTGVKKATIWYYQFCHNLYIFPIRPGMFIVFWNEDPSELKILVRTKSLRTICLTLSDRSLLWYWWLSLRKTFCLTCNLIITTRASCQSRSLYAEEICESFLLLNVNLCHGNVRLVVKVYVFTIGWMSVFYQKSCLSSVSQCSPDGRSSWFQLLLM